MSESHIDLPVIVIMFLLVCLSISVSEVHTQNEEIKQRLDQVAPVVTSSDR